jgi:ELWxxDGT repeat protein
MRSWLVRIWASLLGLVQEPAVPTSRREANRHRSRRSGHFRRAAHLRLEPLEDRTAPATFLLKDIRPGAFSSFPQQMVNVNGVIFFIANDGSTGYELWKSDGTPSGTVLVRDIRPAAFGFNFGCNPRHLTNVNGTLFFVANDGTNGYELWKSDGTSSGTVLVRDINPGAGWAFSPWRDPWFTNVNGTLYFVANDGTTGYELWKSDGTSAGTRLVSNINPGGNSSHPRYLTNVSGTLFFSADDGTKGHELWKSDGTPGGTVLVRDIWPAAFGFNFGSNPRHLLNVNGTLFFAAIDGTRGYELWKSNGTSTGTVLVKDIRPGLFGSYPYSLTNVGGRLFFIANDGTNGRELWISDGTSTGTVLVKDINQGAGHAFGTLNAPPPSFTNVNGTLYFLADDGLYGFELWKSDGTAGGTVRVKDINPGANWAFSDASPPSLTNVRGTLFFAADDGTNGRELWKSNGTDAGTVLVANIRPGGASSNPQWLAEAGGLLFFQADDGTSGAELWVNTDNVQPTTIVNIIAPPNGTYRLGQTLDFTVQFSRTVSVDTSGGTPRLAINLTSGTRYADYVSGSGTDRLVFRYTVQANDFDNNGITLVSPLDLNGGSIVDGFGNTPTLTFTPPNTSGILVDAVVPTVVQVLLPASGIYLTGQNLDFRFRFSKPVLVDTSGGTPRLRVQIGSTVRFADYFSGSGGDTLTFRYTVQASDFDDDGIELIQPPGTQRRNDAGPRGQRSASGIYSARCQWHSGQHSGPDHCQRNAASSQHLHDRSGPGFPGAVQRSGRREYRRGHASTGSDHRLAGALCRLRFGQQHRYADLPLHGAGQRFR